MKGNKSYKDVANTSGVTSHFCKIFLCRPGCFQCTIKTPLNLHSGNEQDENHRNSPKFPHHLSYILAQKEGEHTKGCSSPTLDTVLLVPSKAHIMSVCTFRDNGEATDEESV